MQENQPPQEEYDLKEVEWVLEEGEEELNQ